MHLPDDVPGWSVSGTCPPSGRGQHHLEDLRPPRRLLAQAPTSPSSDHRSDGWGNATCWLGPTARQPSQPRQRLRHVNKQADKSGQEQLQMARSDIRSDWLEPK